MVLARPLAIAAALCVAAVSYAQQNWDARRQQWNEPAEPRRVYGNTYYVGTAPLASILITSDQGHVLIDGAMEESVPLIAANIRKLGFRPEDVKLILNSHAHFDHAGGIAELQKLSGAKVAASPWSARMLEAGSSPLGDPQFGSLPEMAKVKGVQTIRDGETLRVGPLALTAHFTPGHTPGGTSWTWSSCEAQACKNLVYADSLSPVSAPGFRFTESRDYPDALADFEASYAALRGVPCDILLTPHPEFSREYTGPGACGAYANGMRERLQKRIAEEKP
jgi:metallo-beta-lactamase class B